MADAAEEEESEASIETQGNEGVSLASSPVDAEETDAAVGDQAEATDEKEEEAEVSNEKEEQAEVVGNKEEQAEVKEGGPEAEDKVLIIAQETVPEKATNGVKDSETEEEDDVDEENEVKDDKTEATVESNELNDKLAKPLQTVSGALELHFEVILQSM